MANIKNFISFFRIRKTNTLKKLIIENWRQYGDYMFFANLVDKTKEWIMLQTEGNKITAIGKEPALKKYSQLLTEKKVTHSEIN